MNNNDYIEQIEENNEDLRKLLESLQEDNDVMANMLLTIAYGMGVVKTTSKPHNRKTKFNTFQVMIQKNETNDEYIRSLYKMKKTTI